jgi:hypothetical protein
MAGTWRHEQAGRRLAVTIAPFADPGAAVRAAAEAEAARLGGFLRAEPDVAWEAA